MAVCDVQTVITAEFFGTWIKQNRTKKGVRTERERERERERESERADVALTFTPKNRWSVFLRLYHASFPPTRCSHLIKPLPLTQIQYYRFIEKEIKALRSFAWCVFRDKLALLIPVFLSTWRKRIRAKRQHKMTANA